MMPEFLLCFVFAASLFLTFVRSEMTTTDLPISNTTAEVLEKLKYCFQISELIERNSSLSPQEQLQVNAAMTSSDACVIASLCNLHTRINDTYCPFVRDQLGTCFPPTQPGVTASSSCPLELAGIPYDTKDNVTRKCLSNGTWTEKSNYEACKPILDEDLVCDDVIRYFEFDKHDSLLKDSCSMYQLLIIHYVGTGLSLATLAATFLFFWTLRSVRCWRNIIHWNFTGSLILKQVMWIILHLTTNYQDRKANTVFCRLATTLFNYAYTANYFWMFAEGLYLHIMVAHAFVSDRIKLHWYLIIGWGTPVFIVGLWAILKSQYEDRKCWMEVSSTKMVDYYYQIPILITLIINSMILINIVRIILTKLRSRTETVEEEVKHYVKAAKAALFLFPLLGITYLVYFFGPAAGSETDIAFYYVNVILSSFQGLFVSVIYCFANSEIQNALKKKVYAWKAQHDCFHKKDSTKRNYFSMNSMSRGSKSTIMFQAAGNNHTLSTSPITEEHATILPHTSEEV